MAKDLGPGSFFQSFSVIVIIADAVGWPSSGRKLSLRSDKYIPKTRSFSLGWTLSHFLFSIPLACFNTGNIAISSPTSRKGDVNHGLAVTRIRLAILVCLLIGDGIVFASAVWSVFLGFPLPRFSISVATSLCCICGIYFSPSVITGVSGGDGLYTDAAKLSNNSCKAIS